MSVALKLVALLVLAGGAVVEEGRFLAAPGFALAAGALVSAYLWFLANARPRVRPPLEKEDP